jgi:hypothetical protein
MKRTIALMLSIVFCAVVPAFALYTVKDIGDWPRTWPKELEPLRKQARTLVGPEVENRHYAIRFSTREEFESAWPQLLKVRYKATPIFLVSSPNFFLGDKASAGVIVHAPPAAQPGKRAMPEGPIEGLDGRLRWMNATYLELVVDGKIVDLTRIHMPKGVKVIDERSKAAKNE